MPPKAKIPAPIDRPLSKAYVREFTGWSTAEPPGLSDPTSLRVMENVQVNRDGSVRVRPGLRYLSYEQAPTDTVEGIATSRPFVGTFEPFYLADGTKAYLQAVREVDLTVGFRIVVTEAANAAVYALDDPAIDFDIPQGLSVLNFSEATTYVTYLQIDNKIFALSNAGETMRLFFVGEKKLAKTLLSIERPEWDRDDKLTVVHPDAAWILGGDEIAKRRNLVPNPSFEENLRGWNKGAFTRATRPQDFSLTAEAGQRVAAITSKPERINFAASPLHDVANLGTAGWSDAPEDPNVEISTSGDYMQVSRASAGKGKFFARSALWGEVRELLRGEVTEQQGYRVAFDVDSAAETRPLCRVRFFGVNGAQVGEDREFKVLNGQTRWVSDRFVSPKGAVALRVYIGGDNQSSVTGWTRAKNVVFCEASESTDIFTGSSGANYFWTGAVNESASEYHPPADIAYYTDLLRATPGFPMTASIFIGSEETSRTAHFGLLMYGKNDELLQIAETAGTATTVGDLVRMHQVVNPVPANVVRVRVQVRVLNVPRGERHLVDAAMLEPKASALASYFDGASADTLTVRNEWIDDRHESASLQRVYSAAQEIPDKETRTDDTLIAKGGPYVNIYGFGFFYTFNNEVGESAPSKITEKRTQRPWSDWIWEEPDEFGNPSGEDTQRPERACDQLVAYMPEEVFNEARAQGAIEWNLYMVTWSEQDAAPVAALKVGTRALPSTATYETHGWQRVTPETTSAVDEMVLPRKETIFNYSNPSRGANGAVVADRMVVVNDPTAAAVIKWTSNLQGQYTNFTAGKGGGYKTLTSGNLNVPAAVKLWQNPQSADTIVILCLGTDGDSRAYYMAPAQVSSQSDTVTVMGFEETTATPGTTSPFGVETFNNSLYHPLEDQLMKSTASNYNINHKSQSDMIRDKWERLAFKENIISAVHDSRLYLIVTNPEGEPLKEGCNGNEIWVFDAAAKNGTWSRFLIQAHSLHRLEFGGRVYLGVTKPEGLFYLDPDYGMDDVVSAIQTVSAEAIPWSLESNTQGANRAHDAWAHLQQASVVLGFFQGRMRWGVKGVDLNGKRVDVSKIVRDHDDPLAAFDVEDQMRVARDMKEWIFYAHSLEDEAGVVEPSFGQISMVQYRYTPVSVNVGYEHGSVETFEYGRDAALAASSVTQNGIPLPLLDSRRP